MELAEALGKYHVLVIFAVIITVLIADALESSDSVLYSGIVGIIVFFFIEKPVLKQIKKLN